MQDEITIIPTICPRPCNICEGLDHHWLPDCPDDEDGGEPIPVMACKHCDEVREYTDDDE